MGNEALEQLANRIEACVQDARTPIMTANSWPHEVPGDPRIASLANGLQAIVDHLRALSSSMEGEGGK